MQTITSKNTSINTKQLPKIYNMINWEQLRGKKVFDYGCGKPETVNLIIDFLKQYDIQLIPYDPYNLPDDINRESYMDRDEADIFICSNVLNVIDDNYEIQEIISRITKTIDYTRTIAKKMFYFKIYEGNKSGIEKITKKDCFQKNHTTQWYINTFFWNTDVYKKSDIITNSIGKTYFKRSN